MRSVAEMRHGMERYGFRSFKFRDPLFGLDRKRVLALAEQIGRLQQGRISTYLLYSFVTLAALLLIVL